MKLKNILLLIGPSILAAFIIIFVWIWIDNDKLQLQINKRDNRISSQSELINEMSIQIEAYNQLVIQHEQLTKDMAYIASISPLRNIMTPDEISTLLKEVPTGNIFFTPFIVTAPYGISIGYHGKPRTDHRGSDIHPDFPPNNEPMDMRVKPVGDGYIETFGEDDTYGKFIIVRYSERVRSFYGHLGKIFYAGTTGRKVTKDTVIGIMGNTGKVFSKRENGGGKHVHHEIQVWDGHTWVSIDPEPFLENE